MLVALRELGKEEACVLSDVGNVGSSRGFERLYSLYAKDTSATVVDVTDGRARKTFNFDVRTTSNAQLSSIVMEPLLETVLVPEKASQNVLVVDGTRLAREAVLFGSEKDCQDGLLVRSVRHIMSRPNVASVFLGGVTLEDDNRLVDIFAGTANSSAVTEESPAGPVILEDVRDQFTAVEDACYQEVRDEQQLKLLAGKLRAALSESKHQVFPIIVAFQDDPPVPNTTVQFVSFAVGEMARGMKSTRHCVSAAASLLECHSPVLPFNGTKVSFLLKPALCGTQPGAWICCFSPVTPAAAHDVVVGSRQATPGVPSRETFKEAFSIAQMASRVYSSRIGVSQASLPQIAPPTNGSVPTAREAGGVSAVTDAPLPNNSHPAGSSENPPERLVPSDKAAQRHPQHAGAAAGLVDTPFTSRPSPPQMEASTYVDSSARPMTTTTTTTEKSTHDDSAASTSHDFQVYREAMERAVERLREDAHDNAKRLERAREELGKERARSEALARQVSERPSPDEANAAMLEVLQMNKDLKEANKELGDKLEVTRRTFEEQIHSLEAEAKASESRMLAEVGMALTTLGETSDARRTLSSTTAEEVTILKARVAELMDLVTHHQSEIRAHVDTEKSYRERILTLEEALRARVAECQDLNRELLDTKDELRRTQKTLETALTERRAEERAALTSQKAETEEGHSQELARLQHVVSDLSNRLRDTLVIVEREQSQRAALEHQLQRERMAAKAPRAPIQEDGAASGHVSTDTRAVEKATSADPPEQQGQRRFGRRMDMPPATFKQNARLAETPPQAPPPPPPPRREYGSRAEHAQREARPNHTPNVSSALDSTRSGSASVASSGAYGRRPTHGSANRSFEEFMQEEPSFQLRQNIPLNFQPRSWRSQR